MKTPPKIIHFQFDFYYGAVDQTLTPRKEPSLKKKNYCLWLEFKPYADTSTIIKPQSIQIFRIYSETRLRNTNAYILVNVQFLFVNSCCLRQITTNSLPTPQFCVDCCFGLFVTCTCISITDIKTSE